ncbi:MAG: ribonuclease P protein component [Synergistaceae bacterium]|jgi:ribonuclease P protein component|nr:ribonuclease P protein component [Synergistaceae bacterium]
MDRLFGFPDDFRLKKGWEFDRVFRTGRRVKGELVRLLFLDTGDGPPRLGAAVGKRQGSSVRRNRGRRILREAFRHCRPWLKEGVWIVAMLRTVGLSAGAREIYTDLVHLLEAEGLLKPGFPKLFPTQGEKNGEKVFTRGPRP